MIDGSMNKFGMMHSLHVIEKYNNLFKLQALEGFVFLQLVI